jgi:hypothetical protein
MLNVYKCFNLEFRWARTKNGKKKIVSFATNVNGMEIGDDRTKKTRKTIRVPFVANFYNKNKNSVDAIDHLIENVHSHHKYVSN